MDFVGVVNHLFRVEMIQNWFYVSSSNEARSKWRKAECDRSKICIDRHSSLRIGYFKSPQSGIRDTPFGSGLQVVSIRYFNLCGTRSSFTLTSFVWTRYVESISKYPKVSLGRGSPWSRGNARARRPGGPGFESRLGQIVFRHRGLKRLFYQVRDLFSLRNIRLFNRIVIKKKRSSRGGEEPYSRWMY